jgi:hypothetical protein
MLPLVAIVGHLIHSSNTWMHGVFIIDINKHPRWMLCNDANYVSIFSAYSVH